MIPMNIKHDKILKFEHQKMEFPPAIGKSFKSHDSYKHKSIDESGANNEKLPILLGNEVIVKVDASDNDRVGRDPSFDYLQKQGTEQPPPPSMVIREFLNEQRGQNGEVSFPMEEVKPEELKHESYPYPVRNLPPSPDSPSKMSSREIRVSFEPTESGSFRRRYKDDHGSSSPDEKREEVLRCTSNKSFRKQPSRQLKPNRTKSRLLDDEGQEAMSGLIPKSGPIRSGMVGWAADDEDEDDPLDDSYIPDEFMKNKFSLLTLLQWLSLIILVAALACSLSIHSLKEKSLLNLELWKWEVLLLVLICGRLVSGWGIRLTVICIERNFLLRKRVLYFVYGLRKGVQNCCWLGLVLLSWHLLFHENGANRTAGIEFLNYLTKILVCFLVASFIWLLKTLMVKVLASSFHVSTYFDRIQESIFNQYVIETLSGPPVIEISQSDEALMRRNAEIRALKKAGATLPPGFKKDDPPSMVKGFKAKTIKISTQMSSRKGESKRGELKRGESKMADDEIAIDHLHKLNTKNVSAWNMKRLMKFVRHGSLSTLDEQIHGSTLGDESATQIRTELEAKAAARKIFYNVSRPGSKCIYYEDLLRFLGEEEAQKTMSFFQEEPEISRIKKKTLKNWVVNVFRERRALALTLNDTKTAVNQLHRMVNIIVGIIIVAICLVILQAAASKIFVVIGSQLVVVSFIFGNTAKTLFESIIFLFVIHPFDVGDRCEVDGSALIVEEMNIMTTYFLRSDNLKVVYPNSVLASKPIGNFYRSPDMVEIVEFYIHVATPLEKLADMKQRITSYIDTTKEFWYPGPTFMIKDVMDMQRMKIAIWTRQKINYQDVDARYIRRSLLIEELLKIFKELDIARLWPIDISVRSLPSKSACAIP